MLKNSQKVHLHFDENLCSGNAGKTPDKKFCRKNDDGHHDIEDLYIVSLSMKCVYMHELLTCLEMNQRKGNKSLLLGLMMSLRVLR